MGRWLDWISDNRISISRLKEPQNYSDLKFLKLDEKIAAQNELKETIYISF